MTKIFISYSRVDEAFTKELAELLRDVYDYNNVWYDAKLHQRGGMKWWETILDAIESADIFLYLLSNESVQSPFCQSEFAEAQRLNKHIVTVQVRDRTQIPPELSDIQYVDMKRGIQETHAYNNLITSINNIMQQPIGKRVKWQGRTPKPEIATELEKTERDDVTTPKLLIARPPETRKPANASGNWLIGSSILFVVLAFVGGSIFFANNGNNPNPTQSQTLELENTTEVPLDVPLITVTSQATETEIAIQSTNQMTPTGLPTIPSNTAEAASPSMSSQAQLEARNRAEAGVNSNEEWKLFYPDEGYMEEFDGVEMLLVPRGCFELGNDPDANDGDNNNGVAVGGHICFERPFWIDKTEVTQEDFERLNGVAEMESFFIGSERPVEQITWIEALAFCKKRGGRLPTEVEWEYAARGVDNLDYPWGPLFVGDYAVFEPNSDDHTADVGSRPEGASWVGAMDMSGNVWEWTSTLYRGYPYRRDSSNFLIDERREDEDISRGPRVLRGGYFSNNNPDYLHTAARIGREPDEAKNSYGFRCARNVDD